MKAVRNASWLASFAALFAVAGCPLGPSATTVEFVNETSFPVEVRYFYGDEEEGTEELLEAFGQEREMTVPAGGTSSVSYDCDALQNIFIKEADLRIIGGIGPSDSTGVFRDGEDFGCGDTIRFTLRANTLNTDLDIIFARQ